MDFLEEIINYIDNPEDNLTKLITEYEKNNKTLHLFFEGEDDIVFYNNFVKLYFNDFKIYKYECKGKRAVIKFYDELEWSNYIRNRLLFFVDNDFDNSNFLNNNPNPIPENLFITKYYSIENYLTTNDAFEQMLNLTFKFNLHSKFIQKLKQSYSQLHQDFFYNIIIISAWMLYQRKNNFHAEFEGININDLLKLKDFKLFKINYKRESISEKIKKSNISGFDKSLITNDKKLQYLKAKTNANNIEYKQIKFWINKINNTEEPNTRKYIRGKQDIQFFITVFKMLKNDVIYKYNQKVIRKNKNQPENKKIKRIENIIELTEKNIFILLSDKISIPEELKKFFILNKKKLL